MARRIVHLLRYLLSLTLLLSAACCATDYGEQIPQTTIIVHSAGSDRMYYILRPHQEREFLGNNMADTPRGTNPDFESFLKTLPQFRSNGPPLIHRAGQYTLVVECKSSFKQYTVYLSPNNESTMIDIACED